MVTLPGTSAATTLTLMWTGAKRVNIMCNVAGGPGVNQAALSKELCRDVERLATRSAPIPVRMIVIGDPAVLDSDAVTLLVHASVSRHGQQRLLAFTIRPFRTSSEQAGVLFGAIPRVAPLASSGVGSATLDAALFASLSETLPWLTKPRQHQRIPRRP